MTGTGHDGSEGLPDGRGRVGRAWSGAGRRRGLAG